MANQEQTQDQVQEQSVNESVEQAETVSLENITIDPAYVTELEQKLDQANHQLNEEKDRAIRAVAEMDNIRRRAAQDVEKARKFALEKFVTELLPVIDNLERTLQVADKDNESVKPLIEGVELTLKSMNSTVAKFGVVAIDPQGQPFDPNQHQAMSMIENGDVAPNTVIAVMQKGFELNGRVVRPAMVVVSKAPSAKVDVEV